MFTALIAPLSTLFGKVLDKIPDANEKLKLQAQFNADLMTVLSQADQAQNDVNKVEAANSNLFIAGWRPFVGWVCAISFTYHVLLQPLIAMILLACGIKFNLPILEDKSLDTLLYGMLGMGTLRTVEKFKP